MSLSNNSNICVIAKSTFGDCLEKEMAIHSSTIAWKIPWTEKPGRLQSVGLQRVGHDWATSLSLSLYIMDGYLLYSVN